MGTWGTGLYSGDAALETRATVKVLLSIPLSFQEIKQHLLAECDDPILARLILADQLEKRGLRDEAIAEDALKIIKSGRELDQMRDAGMSGDDLARRASVLNELADRLRNPSPPKSRKTLKAPQPLLLEPGQIWRLPHRGGYVGEGYVLPPEAESGWRLVQVIDAGHAFGYLSWYRLSALNWVSVDMPLFEEAEKLLRHPAPGIGTLTKPALQKFGMELLGTAPLPICYWPTPLNLIRFATIHNIGIEKWFNYGGYEGHGPLLDPHRHYDWDAA